jgi:zinc protease
MSPILRIAVLSALFATGLAKAAIDKIDLSAPIPVGPQVKVGKLPNGLTYYIQRNGKPEHRLELRLAVKAGSVLEEDDQQGLAHFAEHMAFNGTTHFKKHELVSWLQSIGVKFGPDLNAFTSMDDTIYLLPVPTQNKEHVDQAFTILEDWAHGLTFDDAIIDKERSIVLEEARTRKGAGERVRKALMARLFEGSRYAVRDPIGKEEILRSFKPDTLRRFYRDWYRPDLMAVVAVGDFDPAEIERQIVAHFGPLRNPEHERARIWDDIKPLTTTEAMIVTDRELSTSAVVLNYPVRAAPVHGTYGDYREKTVERVFGSLMGMRLAELAQQANPPFMGASSGLSRPTPRHKNYVAGVALGAGGSAPAIEALLAEHQRVREYGFGADELERVRKVMLKGIERGFNERNTTDSSVYASEYLRNFLNGESIPGIAAEYQLMQELLPGIGLEEINAFARKTIPTGPGKLVVYTGGEREGVAPPSGSQLLAEVETGEHAKVSARNEGARRAPDGAAVGAGQHRRRIRRQGAGPDPPDVLERRQGDTQAGRLPPGPGADEGRALRRPEPVRGEGPGQRPLCQQPGGRHGPEGLQSDRPRQDACGAQRQRQHGARLIYRRCQRFVRQQPGGHRNHAPVRVAAL